MIQNNAVTILMLAQAAHELEDVSYADSTVKKLLAAIEELLPLPETVNA